MAKEPRTIFSDNQEQSKINTTIANINTGTQSKNNIFLSLPNLRANLAEPDTGKITNEGKTHPWARDFIEKTFQDTIFTTVSSKQASNAIYSNNSVKGLKNFSKARHQLQQSILSLLYRCKQNKDMDTAQPNFSTLEDEVASNQTSLQVEVFEDITKFDFSKPDSLQVESKDNVITGHQQPSTRSSPVLDLPPTTISDKAIDYQSQEYLLKNGEEKKQKLLSPTGTTEVNVDSVNRTNTTLQSHMTLNNTNMLTKSPGAEEVKSVKFQILEDYTEPNGVGSVNKKSRISPVRFPEVEPKKFKSPTKASNVTTQSFFKKEKEANKIVQLSKNHAPDVYSDDESTAVRTGLCGCANLSTRRGRRNHALLIMLVSVVPVVALLLQNSIDLSEHNEDLQLHLTVKNRIIFSVETGNVIHRTQIERGLTALYVSSKGDEEIKKNLLNAYIETDKQINSLTYWVVEPGIDHLSSVEAYHEWIKDFRNQVMSGSVPKVTVSEVISFYSNDNAIITRWVGGSIQESKSGDLWKTLVGYYMLVLSKEQAGVERALGSTFFAQGGFDKQEMLDYLERKILGLSYLDRCQEYSTKVKMFLLTDFIGQETDISLTSMRTEILLNSLNRSDVGLGTLWFYNMTKYIDVLKKIQDTLAFDILAGLQEQVDLLNKALLESICVMVAALVLFPLVILTVYRLTNRIQDFAQTLQERTQDLDIERKRSETLLFELLPVSVARKLLNHEEVPPVTYQAVTIFFSDIVGFTSICSKSTPMQVIDMLNSLYRLFDDIIDTYDVYKVETIGDAYMVVSGLPQQNLEGHAREMANMALDVRETISQLTVQHLPGERLQMRIGLNSGPVVAGVVGHKMPRYCLFGDTVNVASRMESTSLPLHIQVSASCCRELMKAGGFLIRERGTVEIKGKGDMTTFWLDGRTQSSPADENQV